MTYHRSTDYIYSLFTYIYIYIYIYETSCETNIGLTKMFFRVLARKLEPGPVGLYWVLALEGEGAPGYVSI